MIHKRLVVIVYGPDRQLFTASGLECTVTDVFDNQRVLLRRQDLSPPFALELDLPFESGRVYGLLVEAADHRPGWHLVSHDDFVHLEAGARVEQDEAILRIMLVPARSEPVDLAGARDRLVARDSPFVRDGGVDAATWAALEPAAAMACLNIEAKLRAVMVGGQSLLSFVAGIEHVAVDRVFLLMRSAAKALVNASPAFASAAGHPAPGIGDLPATPDSWKHTAFPAGNVQLSFSRDVVADGPAGEPCHALDVDIDLARGVGHAFEWLRNNVFTPGHKTDQTSVYALLFDQNVLPAYTLRATAAARAMPRAAGAPSRKRRARKAPAKRRAAAARPAGRKRAPAAGARKANVTKAARPRAQSGKRGRTRRR